MAFTIGNLSQDAIIHALSEAMGISAENLSKEQIEEYIHLLQQEQLAETTWHARFEEQVARTPQANALTIVEITEDSEYKMRHISYQELNERVDQLTSTIQQQITPGMLVGIAIERSFEQILALLSVLKAGASAILIEPERPIISIKNILNRLQISCLLVKRAGSINLDPDASTIFSLEELVGADEPEHQANTVRGDNTSGAYVISESGIAIDHQSLLKRIYRLQRAFTLTVEDTLLGSASAPETFVLEVLWPLLYGARIVLAPSLQPDHIALLAETIGGTILCCVPPQIAAYNRLFQQKAPSTSLRLLLCEGGVTVPRMFQQEEWRVPVPLSYLVQSLSLDIEVALATVPSPSTSSELIPELMPGIAAYVLDKNGQIAPPGSPGTVYLDEDTFGTWSHNRSALQVEHNPLGESMLIASELRGKLLAHTAQVLILDALQHIAWLDGRMISLTEIRRALLADMAVEDCAVYVRTAEPLGRQQLVAYVVPAQTTFVQEQVQSRLKDVLPPLLLPTVYVLLERLPLTNEGALDEATLLRQEVLDDDVVQRYEQRLQACPDVSQAVAILQQKHEAQAFYHISDILPPVESSEAATTSDASTQARMEEVARPLALVHGPQLQIEPDLPWTLSGTLQRAARLYPKKRIVYLTLQGEVREQTFLQLLEESSRLLAGLRRQRLQPGSAVIFQLEHNWDIVPAYWACMLGGFAPAILALPPTYQETNNALEKFLHVWQLLDHPFLITSHDLRQSVTTLQGVAPEIPVSFAYIEDLRTYPPEYDYYQSDPDETALFSLTSGSTSLPKCIMLSHRQLLGRARATAQSGLNDRDEQDIILNWLPFDHIGAISDHHIRCIDVGCQAIYVPTPFILQQPARWLDIIDTYRCTQTWAPNFAYALLLDACKEIREGDWDLSCVKTLLTGGESVSVQVIEQLLQALAPYGLKKTTIQPSFGMAELCSGFVYYLPTEDCPVKAYTIDKRSLHFVDTGHHQSVSFTSLGTLVPSYSMRIVDDNGVLLPEGVIGRLQVMGPYMFSGYYKNPEQNRAVFVDGWFNTGDLAFIMDENLVITGREKEVIIIKGANYFNHDIEQVINSIPGVATSYSAACAVRVGNTTEDRLALFFVSERSSEKDLIALIREVKIQVAKQIGITPDYIIPVKREDIPKTTIGKIQRTQLSHRFEQGTFQETLKYVDVLLENERTLPEWFYRKIWVRREEAPVMESYHVPLIFLDQEGLGEVLATFYDSTAIVVYAGSHFSRQSPHSFTINASSLADYKQLLRTLMQEGLFPDTLLHLWSYSRPLLEQEELMSTEQLLQTGVVSLLLLCQALEQEMSPQIPLRLFVVTSHAQAVEPTDPLTSAKATVYGLLKSIAQEYSWLHCRHVDLPLKQPEREAAIMHRETSMPSGEHEVAYREEKRYVPRLEKLLWAPTTAHHLPFEKGGFYVLSGGLGGIGVEVARYLIKHFQAHILLLGRSTLPPREQWHEYRKRQDILASRILAFQELEMLSKYVRYASVDISDSAAVQSVVSQVANDWQQPIAGVIHLAGLFHEKSIAEETPASLQSLLRPKMLGAWSLYELIRQQHSGLFLIFSSLTGFFGGAMVGAYAAANSFADAFAAHLRNHHALESYSLAWSIWKDIGIGRVLDHAEILTHKGYMALTAQQGINSLLAVLAHHEPQTFIGLDVTKQHIRRLVKRATLPLYTLIGYFTASGDQEISERMYQSVSVEDRFHNPCSYELHQLQMLPVLENGDIDYTSLIALGMREQMTNTNEYTPPHTKTEELIAHIWQDVLGVNQVGIYNSLFELGGDSLHVTQIAYKMKSKGLPVSVKQLFQYPTISALARQLHKESLPITAEQGAVEGEIPLTSAQQAFFEKQLLNPHYFNQAYLFEPKIALNPASMERAVESLLVHHDALRLRLEQTKQRWVQRNAAYEPINCFAIVDLSMSSAEQQKELLASHIAQIHRSLNLTHGPLIRVVLFLLSPHESRLLFVLHHFVTDQLSWKILLEDFFTAYQQVEADNSPVLPQKSSSLQDWSRQLVRYASSQQIQNERAYWLSQAWHDAVTLPYDHPQASNKEARVQVVMQSLSRQETETLLQQATKVFGAAMRELVLAAFNDALAAWIGEGLLPLDLTHHGRDPLFENLDVSRTVGWFSIAFPVLLSMAPAQNLHERVEQVQQTLQRVPGQGYSYGLLRYTCADRSVRKSMSHIPQPEVLFNYLGQVDHIRGESAYLRSAKESRGSLHDPEGERLYQLVFNGRLVNGCLEILCLYGREIIEKATATHIIEHMVNVLREMIAACRPE